MTVTPFLSSFDQLQLWPPSGVATATQFMALQKIHKIAGASSSYSMNTWKNLEMRTLVRKKDPMKRFALILLIPSMIVLAGIPAVNAQDKGTTVDSKTASSQSAEDRTAIVTAIKSYKDAFNLRDANGLAKHWSKEGVYTSRLTGQAIVGRDALEKEFTSLFAEVKDTKMKLETESIEFVSPNVDIEQGVTTIIQPETEPATSGYSVVYVKREGQWLIDRVSEEEEPAESPTHYEQLKDLAWIIGDWVDQNGSEFKIETTCKWT